MKVTQWFGWYPASAIVTTTLLDMSRHQSDKSYCHVEIASGERCRYCGAGGFGTLEEGVEVLTWSQLGFHTKPVAVLNINGFYDHLLAFFDHCVTEVQFTTP